MAKIVNNRCILCKGVCFNEETYGKSFENDNWKVHHYCMLFTNACEQNGQDDEGYEGFLRKDIVKAARAMKNYRCCRCKKTGANILCSTKQCRNFYHTGCAIKLDCNFQFENSFPVFCPKHKAIKFKEERPIDSTCGICFEKLSKKNSILIPCCKNSWFHRRCLQKYANTSGYYHFKCPLCADKSKCINQLPKMGIFMPMRDAQWEIDNDFEEMAAPPQVVCEFCDSSQGAEENYLWKMCDICGSSGVHWRCLEHTESQNFTCRHCHEILDKKENQPKPKTPRKQKRLSDDGLPILYLASDEENCSSSDEDEPVIKPRFSKAKLEFPSESDNENIDPGTCKANVIKSDSSDDEIVKPKMKRKHRMPSSSSDDSDFEPRRYKKMRVMSSPEAPKTSRSSTRF